MAYGRSRRRRSRSRTVPGTRRSVRYSKGSDLPAYSRDYSHKKLLKVYPLTTPDETYYFNNNGDAASPTANNFHALNTVAMGDALDNRTANRMKMRWMLLKLMVQIPTTMSIANSNTQARLSVVIFYDREPYGFIPHFTDVYDTVSYLGQQRVENRDRFEILYRKDFPVGCDFVGADPATGLPTFGYARQSSQTVLDLKIPINRTTSFQPDKVVGDPSYMKRGGLWIWFLDADRPGSASVNWRVKISHRITFTDYV